MERQFYRALCIYHIAVTFSLGAWGYDANLTPTALDIFIKVGQNSVARAHLKK
jgi:hypothetical protein